MAYSKYYSGGWKNNEDGNTPITAAALNHMESGIVSANVIVSTTTAGLMSAQDKSKLNGITAGASVTGIKGNAESSYRSGNVNLTAANIGALPSNTTYVSGVKGNSETTYRSGNVNITPVNIGAVAKSGDTMTGRLNVNNGSGNGVALYKDGEGGTILVYAADGHIYEIDAASGDAVRIHNNQSRTAKGEDFHQAVWNAASGQLTVDSLQLGTTPLQTTQGGTGLRTNPSMLVNLESTSASNVLQALPRPGIMGVLSIGHGGTSADNASDARDNLGAAQFIRLDGASWASINEKLNNILTVSKPALFYAVGGDNGTSKLLTGGKTIMTLQGIVLKSTSGIISFFGVTVGGYTPRYLYNWRISNLTSSGAEVGSVFRFIGEEMN